MTNFFGSDPSMRLELEQRLAAGINLPDAERLGVALVCCSLVCHWHIWPRPACTTARDRLRSTGRSDGYGPGRTSNRDIGIAASRWPDVSCRVRQPLSRASGSTVIPLYGGLAPAGS